MAILQTLTLNIAAHMQYELAIFPAAIFISSAKKFLKQVKVFKEVLCPELVRGFWSSYFCLAHCMFFYTNIIKLNL